MEPLPKPMSLREVFGIVVRQWPGILLIFCVAVGLGVAYVSTAAPVYQSRTTILVENSEGQPANDPVSAVTMQTIQRDLNTQMEIIQSTKLMNDVYRLANIDVPQIMAGPNPEIIMPSLRVEPVGDSSALRITVESGNPDYAVAVARAAPEVYLGYVKVARHAEVENAIKFLDDRLKEERLALDKAEADLVEFKRRRNLLPLEGEGGIRSSQAAGAESSIAQIDAQIAAAEERIRALEAIKARLPKTLRTPTVQANASMIEAQKSKISDLKAQRNSLLVRLLPDNEQIVALDGQIRDAEQRLKEIPTEMDASDETRHPDVLAYEQKIADAKAELKGLQAQRQKLVQHARSSERDLVEYNAIAPEQDKLVRAVDERKQLLGSISASIEELNVRRNAVRDPVTVLTPASGAAKIRPRPEQTILLSILFGLFMGVAFALLKDSVDDRLTSAEEVYRLTGFPSLGEVFPRDRRVARALPGGGAPTTGRHRERYRILRFNVDLTAAKTAIRSVMVTSSGRLEGKTEVACNLAIAYAEGGLKRVILVDADLRWPSIHKITRVQAEPGLAEVILGQATLEEALQPGPVPGLMILASGGTTANPVDLLATPEMQDLARQLADRADLVIYDVPGTVGLADAQILSHSVDSAVYVAKVGRTRRGAMRKGIDGLIQSGVRLLGVVTVAEKARR